MKSAFLAAVYPALDKASAIQGNAWLFVSWGDTDKCGQE